MVLTQGYVLLIAALFFLACFLSNDLLTRFGIPTLLLFIGVGMLMGEDGIGGLVFDNYTVTNYIGAIALNYILFAGGMETRWDSVRPVVVSGVVLATLGVVMTAVIVGLFASLSPLLSFQGALLLGAIVSSTDAASVFSILRSQKIVLKDNLQPLLELESGSNDPMAYMLTITLISMMTANKVDAVEFFGLLGKQLALGGLCGYGMGHLMSFIMARIRLTAEGLYPVLLMGLAVFSHTLTDIVDGNGFLASYVAGLVLGNSRFQYKYTVVRFYDGLSALMQVVLFVMLGLLVTPRELVAIAPWGFAISAFLMFVARPLSIFAIMPFFKRNAKQNAFISAVGFRGAASITFALYPLTAGIPGARTIFNIVFFVAFTSVLFQSPFLPWLAKKLKLGKHENPYYTLKSFNEYVHEMNDFLAEFDITKGSRAAGKAVMDLHLPQGSLIIVINRDGHYASPTGTTIVEPGDKLLVSVPMSEDFTSVCDRLEGKCEV